MVSKSVERAQGQVEAQNFEARKNVLKYDEVMNRQREVIYAWRQNLLLGEDSADLARDWIDAAIEGTIRGELEMAPAGQWDLDDLMRELTVLYPATVTQADLEGVRSIERVVDVILEDAHAVYDAREAELGADVLRSIEKRVTLSIIDNKWREHLSEMDYLRAGIGLRAMGQRDPLVEYQNEAYNLFSGLVESVKRDAVRYLYHVEVVDQTTQQPQRVQAVSAKTGPSKPKRATAEERIGRNEPCHCGSGKKYKKCHGAVE
ncbi:MAG: SEC-C metal-binding domain-containing protein [Acidimicrobiia bacterium]|nr:SEC-C metal-binding domain-containing protein [Acidimicrobiia bacterium]